MYHTTSSFNQESPMPNQPDELNKLLFELKDQVYGWVDNVRENPEWAFVNGATDSIMALFTDTIRAYKVTVMPDQPDMSDNMGLQKPGLQPRRLSQDSGSVTQGGTAKDKPTPMKLMPQRSGRTAEGILEHLQYGTLMADNTDPAMTNNLNEAQRQLFNAICSEVIGEDEPVRAISDPHYSDYDIAAQTRNNLHYTCRRKLALFFNQPKASGK